MTNFPMLWYSQAAAAVVAWLLSHSLVVVGVVLWLALSVASVALLWSVGRLVNHRRQIRVNRYWKEYVNGFNR